MVGAGIGVHGVSTAHDVFRLPDLWQLHLYNYEGALTLGQSVHPIRPGHVSLVPPNTEVHFHYRGRSEHFYVHLRLHDGGTARAVPVMQDAGAESTRLADLLRQAVTAMPTSPREPRPRSGPLCGASPSCRGAMEPGAATPSWLPHRPTSRDTWPARCPYRASLAPSASPTHT